jgi:hypothetical protein
MHTHQSVGQIHKGGRLPDPQRPLDRTPATRAKRPTVEIPSADRMTQPPATTRHFTHYGAGF